MTYKERRMDFLSEKAAKQLEDETAAARKELLRCIQYTSENIERYKQEEMHLRTGNSYNPSSAAVKGDHIKTEARRLKYFKRLALEDFELGPEDLERALIEYIVEQENTKPAETPSETKPVAHVSQSMLAESFIKSNPRPKLGS